jgi:hypothetical protein
VIEALSWWGVRPDRRYAFPTLAFGGISEFGDRTEIYGQMDGTDGGGTSAQMVGTMNRRRVDNRE